MEKLTLEAAINEISQAYAQLENATSDCNEVIESALDAYFGEKLEKPRAKDRLLIEAYKVERWRRKTEIKNIKKLAKAMMKGEKDGVAEETDSMNVLLQTIS